MKYTALVFSTLLAFGSVQGSAAGFSRDDSHINDADILFMKALREEDFAKALTCFKRLRPEIQNQLAGLTQELEELIETGTNPRPSSTPPRIDHTKHMEMEDVD